MYAEDAIADFVRGLDRADSVAVYTFSRNLSRAASLTRDHGDAISGLRKSVAGDDTALYNALLLTLRDAAKVPGRKVVIVFSNGPDNASMVAPDDVRAVAEDEGIPIYVISTAEVNKRPVSSAVFRRIAQRTGGKAYRAKTWQKQVEAFEDIREDLGQLVHRHVLSAAESERGIPQDLGGDRERPGQEIPRPFAARIPPQPRCTPSRNLATTVSFRGGKHLPGAFHRRRGRGDYAENACAALTRDRRHRERLSSRALSEWGRFVSKLRLAPRLSALLPGGSLVTKRGRVGALVAGCYAAPVSRESNCWIFSRSGFGAGCIFQSPRVSLLIAFGLSPFWYSAIPR